MTPWEMQWKGLWQELSLALAHSATEPGLHAASGVPGASWSMARPSCPGLGPAETLGAAVHSTERPAAETSPLVSP
jgi:hypothetical protein